MFQLPEIDRSECVVCGECIEVCPNQAIAVVDGVPVFTHAEACDYCGFCEEVCPHGAVSRPFEVTFAKDEKE